MCVQHNALVELLRFFVKVHTCLFVITDCIQLYNACCQFIIEFCRCGKNAIAHMCTCTSYSHIEQDRRVQNEFLETTGSFVNRCFFAEIV